MRSLAFSPDATHLVSGSGGEWFTPNKTNELILWEVATGREVRRFAGPHDRIYGVAFRPDGKQVASISCDASVRLWNPETGALEQRMVGHTYHIACVAYSRDGRILATGGFDHVAILWDVATGKALHSLRGHDTGVYSLDFSPDGKTLITGRLERRDQGLGRLSRNGDCTPPQLERCDGSFVIAPTAESSPRRRRTARSSSGMPASWPTSSTASWAGTAGGATGPGIRATAGSSRPRDGVWCGFGTHPAGSTSATSRRDSAPEYTPLPSDPMAG